VVESVPVRDPVGGILYCQADDAHLLRALKEFDQLEARIQASELQQYALRFRESEFHRRMKVVLAQL
jgi:hypothetical protein